MVQRYFSMQELQEYIVTLEKAIEEEPNFIQRIALERIVSCFIVSLDMMKQNHEEFIKEAPSGADLEEYLLSYAKAVQGGEV